MLISRAGAEAEVHVEDRGNMQHDSPHTMHMHMRMRMRIRIYEYENHLSLSLELVTVGFVDALAFVSWLLVAFGFWLF
jgi:hypothetical protein